jgi:hypothetical protein
MGFSGSEADNPIALIMALNFRRSILSWKHPVRSDVTGLMADAVFAM